MDVTTGVALPDTAFHKEPRGPRKLTKRSKSAPLGLAWLWAVLFICAFVSIYFPPLNWPDELRNVQLLEDGDYGTFYWRVAYALRDLLSGVTAIGPFDIDARELTISSDWRRINGALRYYTVSGDASYGYYVAKLANLLGILVFVLAFAWWRRAKARAHGDGANATQTFVLCLLVPSVAYQCMQISTDLLFILMSVSLYFVESRKGQFLFSILAFALIVEDRSFIILGVTGLGLAVAPLAIRWRQIVSKPVVRLALLATAVLVGIVIGSALAGGFQAGTSTVASYLSGVHGFGDIRDQLTYTRTINFSKVDGPVLFYAGLTYLPSAGEFVLKTIPLYFLALPVMWRMLKIAITERTERGYKFFFVLLATLFTYFSVTYSTHVFESGRYYFTLIPLLIVALGSFFGESGKFIHHPKVVGGIAGGLIAINVIATLIIAALTTG